jgi:hypothetical protein
MLGASSASFIIALQIYGKLTGDALAESNLTPEDHIDIQAHWVRRGSCSTGFVGTELIQMDSSVQTHERRLRTFNGASAHDPLDSCPANNGWC